jgi:hemoglobin
METSDNAPSHYEAIGGAPAVREAVERFYQRVVTDPQLEHYFVDVELGRLKRHQVLLISQLLGGPTDYDGRTLAEAHSGLGINDADYDKVGGHLLGVLSELEVGPAVLAAIGDALAAVRADIVTVSAAE